MNGAFGNRFRGYDVLQKRDTPSWNERTRAAVDERLAGTCGPRFFDAFEYATLEAICERLVPQPDRPVDAVPIAAHIDGKMHRDERDGFRFEGMPPMRQAWKLGLRGIDEEARLGYGSGFAALTPEQRDEVLRRVQRGEVEAPVWESLPAGRFFESRLLMDVVSAYYAHPEAWNEIGFGGPASPRGYVRLGANLRDPWEAVERDHE